MIPVLAFMLLRPYQNAVIYVLAIAVILGAHAVLRGLPRRARAPATSSSSILFAAPAAILLLIGLIYPAIATIFQSFFDKTGENFVGLENYVWVFTNPEGFWSVINIDHLGARRPDLRDGRSDSPTRSSSTGLAARRC